VSAVIGIDLGTSNSVVAWENEVGRVEVIPDRYGSAIHPSVVSFTDGEVVGGVVVGTPAKERRVTDPRNTIYSFKRLMGQTANSMAVRQIRSRVPYEIEGAVDGMPEIKTRAGGFSAVELSAIMLDHLRELAIARIGRPVEHAVITVPANFNDAQRSATASAGAIAGLKVARVLNEPTAAALAYGSMRRLHEIIAVYDFGGGTFDLTVMKLEDQLYTVLGTAGDSFLGGDDIDERIVQRMLAKVIEEQRVDLRADILAMMKLRSVAEQIKIELSARSRVSVTVPNLANDAKGRPFSLTFDITHAELVTLISDLVDRTISVTKDALSVAQVKMDRISDVILVGGTTRIPYIRNRVAAFFEKAARTDVSPDGAVAIGAALQAGELEKLLLHEQTIAVQFDAHEPVAATGSDTGYMLDDPQPLGVVDVEAAIAELEPTDVVDIDDAIAEVEQWPLDKERAKRPQTLDGSVDINFDVLTPTPRPAPPPRQVVIDVTPNSFGVATAGGYCETLIWRSTPVPVTVKKKYATLRDNQELVRIKVCQGETRILEDNVVLGDVVLAGLPALPRGAVQIEVAFELDTNGMLQVSARDAGTGRTQNVTLDLVGRMNEDEVAAARSRVQKLRR
jgi:molecular chaperone DnaK